MKNDVCTGFCNEVSWTTSQTRGFTSKGKKLMNFLRVCDNPPRRGLKLSDFDMRGSGILET